MLSVDRKTSNRFLSMKKCLLIMLCIIIIHYITNEYGYIGEGVNTS